MKKIFSMAAIALFMAMTSCSGDDSSASTNVVLVKKTVETDEDGSQIITNFNYDGTKLVNTTDNEGWTMNVTYTDDLITKIEYMDEGTLDQRDIYEYNSNNELVSYIMLLYGGSGSGHKSLYTYNPDGTIMVDTFTGDLESQTTPSGSYTMTKTNGNIVSTNLRTFTFDDKNTPFANVLGWNTLNTIIEDGGGINNVTGSTNNLGNLLYSYTYTYENNYPKTAVYESSNGYTYTTEYFYE